MWDGDSPNATFTLWFDSGFGGNEPMPGWASWIGRATGRACRCNGFFKEIRCATHASKNTIVASWMKEDASVAMAAHLAIVERVSATNAPKNLNVAQCEKFPAAG